MGKYDKSAEYKIDKIICETTHNKSLQLDGQLAQIPKAVAVSRRAGQRQMMAELQGE